MLRCVNFWHPGERAILIRTVTEVLKEPVRLWEPKLVLAVVIRIPKKQTTPCMAYELQVPLYLGINLVMTTLWPNISCELFNNLIMTSLWPYISCTLWKPFACPTHSRCKAQEKNMFWQPACSRLHAVGGKNCCGSHHKIKNLCRLVLRRWLSKAQLCCTV